TSTPFWQPLSIQAWAPRLQMSHLHARNPICPRMFANSFCRDSDSADSSDKGYFQSFRTMHSSNMLREGARPGVVRDNLGHANIDVIQNVYGKRAGGPGFRDRKVENLEPPRLALLETWGASYLSS